MNEGVNWTHSFELTVGSPIMQELREFSWSRKSKRAQGGREGGQHTCGRVANL